VTEPEAQMDATTARVVDYALAFDSARLPPATIHECRRRLIDTFACAMGAFDAPLCAMARAVAQRSSGEPSAGIWGCDLRAAPEAAAFANGVTLRYLDMMDTHLSRTRGHPSDTVAGLVAVAEAVGASGRALVEAVMLAYDVFCSFCDAVDVHAKGWDQPVAGVLACAVGAGKLLGLSRERMGHAVSLALAPNMALFRTRVGEMSHWKACAAANGSRNAVFAAFLARDGFTGPSRIVEGRHGLWDAVDRFDWTLPAAGGTPHGVARTSMKCFPLAYHAQPVAWAALALRPRVRIEDVLEIRLETYRLAVDMTGSDPACWAPRTRETAVHSAPYTIAIALLDGDIAPESFAEARLADPAVVALMKKVVERESPELSAAYPASTPCRLRVRLAAGEWVETEIAHPKGHFANPLADAEVAAKFRRAFAPRAGEVRCEAALHALWTLDEAAEVGSALKQLVV